jgi:hypothetical protein
MKEYHLLFHARENLAIGAKNLYYEVVQADTLENAIKDLYQHYSHIRLDRELKTPFEKWQHRSVNKRP